MIWLLPNGVHFEQHVSGSNDDLPATRLIIVAGTSTDTTFKFKLGTNLGSGSVAASTARFRSTWSRAVRFRSTATRTRKTFRHCDHVSIYAGGSVHLRGSEVKHSGPRPQERCGTVRAATRSVDTLIQKHYLPNTLSGSGGNVQFTLVSGTFQDPPTP